MPAPSTNPRVLLTTAYRDGPRDFYDPSGANFVHTPHFALPRTVSPALRFLKQNVPGLHILEFPLWHEYERALGRGWDVVGFSFFQHDLDRVRRMARRAREAGVGTVIAGGYGALAPETAEFGPRWSPDGSKILFISDRTGNNEIFVMNPDGSDITQITQSEGNKNWAEWSPDGRRIAYSYEGDIYLINADGDPESVVRLTSDGKKNRAPSWSPDGRRIVFSSQRSGNWDLWVVNTDGSGLTQLTDDEFVDLYPNWGP